MRLSLARVYALVLLLLFCIPTLGSVSAADEVPATSPDRPPAHELYHEFFVVCDTDGDGFQEFASVTRQPAFQPPNGIHVELRSGANGVSLWNRTDFDFVPPGYVPFSQGNGVAGLGVFGRTSRIRAVFGYGRPLPQPWDRETGSVLSAGDLNDDGVCDLVQYGIVRGAPSASGSDPLCPTVQMDCPTYWRTSVRALDGKTGQTLWQKSWEIPDDGLIVPNVMNGWALAPGPRLVILLTDYIYSPTGSHDIPLATLDHVLTLDAKTGEKGWERPIAFAPFQIQRRVYNATRVTGLADVNGDGVQDIVLDKQVVFRSEIGGGDPPPPGLWLHALNGASGDDLWSTMVLEKGLIEHRGQAVGVEAEADCEELYATFAHVFLDSTGDGSPDAVALYYTEGAPCPNEVPGLGGGQRLPAGNGRYLLHVVPIEGRNGTRLWDITLQGFGYAASLTPPGSRLGRPLLAVGASDPPPDGLPAGSRYPSKDVRITVLSTATGNPVWSHRDRWGLDNQLAYQLALQQMLRNLAPVDEDHDGTLDVLSSPHNDGPQGAKQVLLATAKQRFTLLDGNTGKPRQQWNIWGSYGTAPHCQGQADELTFFVGHPRRLDLIRYSVPERRVTWRAPVWFDPRLYPTTIGVDLTDASLYCAATNGNRTFFGSNLGTFTYYRGRGQESFSQVGSMDLDGRPEWAQPTLMRLFGISPADLALHALEETTPAKADAMMGAVSMGSAGLASSGVGFVLARVQFARRRRGGSP